MGKPIQGHAWISWTESIGSGGDTERTETSQYLQEKKTKVILLVAASEKGTGQTLMFTSGGCGASIWDC